MSKPILLAVGFLLLGFVTGIGAGLYMGGASAVSGTTEKSTTGSSSGFFSSPEAQNQVEANTQLSNRIIELEKELADEQKTQNTILADRLAFYEKYHQQLSIQPFDQNMKITPEMAEWLGLSKEEKQAAEQHLAEVKAELEKVEDADTTLTKQTDNSVSYDIAADKQGDALKGKLNGLLSADIGDDKAKVFMDGSQWAYSSQFSGFLEDKRQVEISWTTQQNGTPTYTAKVSTSNGATWSTSGSSLQPEFQK